MNTDENKMPQQQTQPSPELNESGAVKLQGHIKIFDPETKKVFVNKKNAIHYENFSLALVQSIGNLGKGFITEMVFGNGGSRIDPTGIITYLTPNTAGSNASLYNQTYSKVVNSKSSDNPDPTRNYLSVLHTTGNNYTDVVITCLLDYGEPTNQSAYDTTPNGEQEYVFDELGLQSYDQGGNNMLLTHVVFHPVQKSLNRLVQIDYTVRIQTLSGV